MQSRISTIHGCSHIPTAVTVAQRCYLASAIIGIGGTRPRIARARITIMLRGAWTVDITCPRLVAYLDIPSQCARPCAWGADNRGARIHNARGIAGTRHSVARSAPFGVTNSNIICIHTIIRVRFADLRVTRTRRTIIAALAGGRVTISDPEDITLMIREVVGTAILRRRANLGDAAAHTSLFDADRIRPTIFGAGKRAACAVARLKHVTIAGQCVGCAHLGRAGPVAAILTGPARHVCIPGGAQSVALLIAEVASTGEFIGGANQRRTFQTRSHICAKGRSAAIGFGSEAAAIAVARLEHVAITDHRIGRAHLVIASATGTILARPAGHRIAISTAVGQTRDCHCSITAPGASHTDI